MGLLHSATGWWIDEAGAPEPLPPLEGFADADLVVIGGGYLGMWSAWHLLEREPGCDVVVLESGRCGHGPSGRNGGFVNGYWDHVPELAARFGAERAIALARAADALDRGDRRLLPQPADRRLVPGRPADRDRDLERPGRRLARGRRRAEHARSWGGVPGADARAGAGRLPVAGVPRRRRPAHGGDGPAGAARVRSARGAAAPWRADPRGHRGRGCSPGRWRGARPYAPRLRARAQRDPRGGLADAAPGPASRAS